MYVPPFNAIADDDELRAFVAARAAGQLVTVGPDGAPDATLVPLLWEGDRLVAHLARANPQVARIVDGSSALVVVSGPDTYVSPGWYASKREHGRVVPTWNYTAVQLRGPIRVVDDSEWVLGLVTRLTQAHESGRPDPWAVSDAPPTWVAGRLRAIVGVEVDVTQALGKAKLSQNRSEADRLGVADGLTAEGGPEAQAVATAMVTDLTREEHARPSAQQPRSR